MIIELWHMLWVRFSIPRSRSIIYQHYQIWNCRSHWFIFWSIQLKSWGLY